MKEEFDHFGGDTVSWWCALCPSILRRFALTKLFSGSSNSVVCCSVLQRVAARCSVLQRVAACCSVLLRVAACCSVLHCVAVYCNVVIRALPVSFLAYCFHEAVLDSLCSFVFCIVLQCLAVHVSEMVRALPISVFASWSNETIFWPFKYCNTLQHTATHCNTLQHTATHCKTLPCTTAYCSTMQHNATQWWERLFSGSSNRVWIC